MRVLKRLFSSETLLSILLIVGMAIIAYLPLAFQAGYYRDDWHVAWAGYNLGAQKIATMHAVDRPFMGLIYSWSYMLVGDNPVSWQLYAILFRVLGALILCWLLRLIWPAEKKAVAVMAALFVVYPGFLQLPTASSYSNHLIGLMFGILSVALTIKALTSERFSTKFILTVLSVLSALACYQIMEWMIGFEGVRLVLMAYALLGQYSKNLRSLLKQLMIHWSSYVVGLALFLYWRVFIFISIRSVTDVGLLKQQYISEPVWMVTRLCIETIKSFIDTLFLAWAVPFYSLVFKANYTDIVASVLLGVIAIGLLVIYFRRVKLQSLMNGFSATRWTTHAVWIGMLCTIIPLIPVVLSNRQVLFQDTFDRYTLVASIGAVMAVTGGIYTFLKPNHWIYAISILVIISIMTQFNNYAYYRDFWNYERQVWWQMSWRIPQIKEGTVLVAVLPEGYNLAEDYEIWGPANTIYYPKVSTIGIQSEILIPNTVDKIIKGETEERSFRTLWFQRDYRNSLLVYSKGGSSCLHIIDGNRIEFPLLDNPLLYSSARYSRADLIQFNEPPKSPPVVIFGWEPGHDWCYYYQKASLARQRGLWMDIVQLAEEAKLKGLAATDAAEWLPFFDGYVNTNMYEKADLIAQRIKEQPAVQQTICTGNKTLSVSSDYYVSPEGLDFANKVLCGG